MQRFLLQCDIYRCERASPSTGFYSNVIFTGANEPVPVRVPRLFGGFYDRRHYAHRVPHLANKYAKRNTQALKGCHVDSKDKIGEH